MSSNHTVVQTEAVDAMPRAFCATVAFYATFRDIMHHHAAVAASERHFLGTINLESSTLFEVSGVGAKVLQQTNSSRNWKPLTLTNLNPKPILNHKP